MFNSKSALRIFFAFCLLGTGALLAAPVPVTCPGFAALVIQPVLDGLSPAAENVITVTGTCVESIRIVGFRHLTI